MGCRSTCRTATSGSRSASAGCGRVRCSPAAGVAGTGLAMGLGLDRILMLRKGIADIRLLRSDRPARSRARCATSGCTARCRTGPRSRATCRSRSPTPMPPRSSAIGCGPRSAIARDAVEAVEILSETPGAELPAAARERLGLQPGQKNVLVRVVLRHPDAHADARRRRTRCATTSTTRSIVGRWTSGQRTQSRERSWRSGGRVADAERVLTSRAA